MVTKSEIPDIGPARDLLVAILKASRIPDPTETRQIGRLVISVKGASLLRSLAAKLAIHPWFEHESEKTLLENLAEGVRLYAQERRGKAKEVALTTLSGMAQQPKTYEIWFGLKNLNLKEEISLGEVRFVPSTPEWPTEKELQSGQSSSLFVVIKAVGGSIQKVLERAKEQLTPALALLRLSLWVEFRPKGTAEEQLWFDLDGYWFYKAPEGRWHRGWWRLPSPIQFDVSNDTEGAWRQKLEELAKRKERLPTSVKEAVDVCLSWLEVGMRESNWRVALPACFSAMEAILVPETSGRKAELVTVRSVIVNVAAGEGFFSPDSVMAAYEIRSRLVHGRSLRKVDPRELPDSAASQIMWGYLVLRDFLRFALESECRTIQELVKKLDSSPSATKAIEWFQKRLGGEKVVRYYKEALTGNDPD